MVLKGGVETNKSNSSSVPTAKKQTARLDQKDITTQKVITCVGVSEDPKPTNVVIALLHELSKQRVKMYYSSKPSIKTSKHVDDSKNVTSTQQKKESRARSKTAGGADRKTRRGSSPKRQKSADSWMLCKRKSEGNVRKCTNQEEPEQVQEDRNEPEKKGSSTAVEKIKESNTEARKTSEGQKKVLIYEKPAETYLKLAGREGGAVRNVKQKSESANKRPSEIPKLKQLGRMRSKSPPRPTTATAGAVVPEPTPSQPSTTPTPVGTASKVTIKSNSKESEKIQSEDKENATKVKRKTKMEDKIRQAMKENFGTLVPLCEGELKKITDTWVNTIYCSLTLRNHLVKLLYDAVPNISRSHFHMEDEIILHGLARARSYTGSEAENLIQFIKLLIGNRNKTKDEYTEMLANKDIAETYNNNWRLITKKIMDIGEETKQLQMNVPELIKKKENYEAAAKEKIQKMEASISQRVEEIKRLENQLRLLKQREHSYKGNVSLKIEDYKDIKEEVLTLKSLEKEFEDLKATYNCQNDVYEKKIKDLEGLLEEKTATLRKEKEMKKQLRDFLVKVQTHQHQLYRTIGKDQVDYVMGRTDLGRKKRLDQLWMSAIKLVLRGFIVQMRKLERDRNKMLLQVNSNDAENYSNLATAIVQKDNFINSIGHQMQAFDTASKYQTAKNSESSIPELLKS